MDRFNLTCRGFAAPAVLLALAGGAAPAQAQVWPINATPAVSRSFGSNENSSIHGGLDIPAARGTSVRAAVTGRISRVATDGTNPDVSDVWVTDANGIETYYGHIQPIAGQTIRVFDAATPLPANTIQSVTQGQNFAVVRRAGNDRSGSFGHIHFAYSQRPGVDNTDRDPLRYFFPANTVSEEIVHHSMTYRPLDGGFPIYGETPRQTRRAGTFIRGNVELLGEISDNMGGDQFVGTEADDPNHRRTDLDLFRGYRAVPYEVGSLISKPAYVNRGDIAERRLVRFDQTDGTHQADRAIFYDDPTRNIAAGNPMAAAGERGGNSDNYTFALTRTSGTGPSATNYWNTNAESGVPNNDGSTTRDTRLNAQAQFQDGVYTLGAKGYTTSSGNGGTGVTSSTQNFRALVNNFKQTAEAKHAANQAPSVMDPQSNETFSLDGLEREFSPTPTLNDIFQLNEDVYASGAQYVNNGFYTVYVEPFRAQWFQGDSLASNAVAIATMGSDVLGAINGQFLWAATQMGQFNIIIDYNHDGVFSWTLDGVGSFRVVPTPGALALLGLGGLAALRRRRSK